MKTLFRTIKWYVHFYVTLWMIYPKIMKHEKNEANLSLQEIDNDLQKVTGAWAKKQVDCSGAEVIVTGQENLPEENVLFVSNHQGNFDIPVHMHYLIKPKGFIAKKSLEKLVPLNYYFPLMNSVFIDRNNLKDAARVMVDAINILKEGHSLIIYPEGTRAQSSNLGEFKNGAVKIATKAKVKIVPVSIDGTYKIMEANNNLIKPGTIRLHIHEPIDTVNLSKEEISGLNDKLKEIIGTKVTEFSKLN